MRENVIGYEYKEIITDHRMEAMYRDCLPYFGWQLDASIPSVRKQETIILRFKRDRKLCNKSELTRLQRQFEAYVKEIIELEASKTTKAKIVSFTVGLVGTAFMAGATFSYLGGHVFWMILLAIPAFLGWILPYLLYRSIAEKQTREINPLMEQLNDDIYTICEKANLLLMK